MESFFDNQFQFMKHFDVKAQGKPQRKKKWLLSRQYLQPLNEPDDEDSARDDQDDSPASYKKKLKCAYEAAKYGMKEGVLTGVFLGGCWGIFKQLGENFTVTFRGSGSVGDAQGGERNAAGISDQRSLATSRRSSRKEPSMKSVTSTERNRSPSLKSNDAYQDNISNYKKTMSIIREKSREKNFYNGHAANRLIYKYGNSKLPVKNEKEFSPLHSVGAGMYDPTRFNFRTKEKVEIVGYAFIQTTNSITGVSSGSGSIKSSGSDSPKNTGSKTEKGNESKISQNDNIKMTTSKSTSNKSSTDKVSASVIGSEERKSVQSGKQSVKSAIQSAKIGEESAKGSRQSIRSIVGSRVVKSMKSSSDKSNSGSIVVSSGDIITSQTSARVTEHSKSTLPDVVEETQNSTPVSTIRSGNVQSDDDFQQRIVEESSTAKVSSFEGAVVKQESKISGLSNLTYSNSSYQEFRQAAKHTDPNANDNYNQKSRQDSDDVLSNKFTSEKENIYPDPKKTPTVLVDVDKISNGFSSPQTDAQSRQSRSQYSDQKASFQTSPASPTSRYSDGTNSSELVAKSPVYANSTSKTSAVSGYKVESSPKITRSSYGSGLPAEEKYVIEGTPSYDRSISDSEDRQYKVESSPDYIRSRGETISKISPNPTITYEGLEERRYSAEESFVSRASYVSETQEERPRKSSSPLYSASRVSETQGEPVFALSRSSTYTKSYINALQDEGIAREESYHSRSNVIAAESATRSMKSFKDSGLFDRRDRESVDSKVKSYTSAAPSQEKYSIGSHGPSQEKYSIGSRAASQEKYFIGSRGPSQEKYFIGSRGPSQEKYSTGSRGPSQEKYSTGSRTASQEKYSHSSHGPSHEKYSTGSRTASQEKYSQSSRGLSQERYSGGSRVQSKSAFEEMEPAMATAQYSASPLTDKPLSCNEFSAGGHNSFEQREVGGAAATDMKNADGVVSSPKRAATEKVVKEEETTKKSGFSFLSAVNENVIVLSACNCAIVLGVVCSLISTTRASLAV